MLYFVTVPNSLHLNREEISSWRFQGRSFRRACSTFATIFDVCPSQSHGGTRKTRLTPQFGCLCMFCVCTHWLHHHGMSLSLSFDLPLSCKVVNPFFWFWRLPKKSVEALAAGDSTHCEFRAANNAAKDTHAQVLVIIHCFWLSERSTAVYFSSYWWKSAFDGNGVQVVLIDRPFSITFLRACGKRGA